MQKLMRALQIFLICWMSLYLHLATENIFTFLFV